jgi:maltose alpha-D-glucosyltransferase/alpha-amylase
MLHPQNKAILACLRSYGGVTLLSVNNLSTEPQSAALDLSRFAGTAPVDLFTGERGEAVTEAAWQVELPASGYRWVRFAAA